MALPKLEANRYTCELPISKQKVEYRAFLVKEQKHLLIAGESEDSTTISKSVMDLIEQCVLNDVNMRKAPISDVEFLFVQIRIKSAGETSDIQLKCEHCEELNTVSIPLDKLEMNMEIPDSHIKLGNGLGMNMTYPSMKDLELHDNMNETEQVFALIAACVESIYEGDEVYTRDDFNNNELKEFIDSMDIDQFTEVQNYMTNIPRLEHKVNFVCSHCQASNELVLSGLSDFF